MVYENYQKVQENIAAACQKAGRSPEEVTLIAVSKTKPEEMIQELYDKGVRAFGENKVQEMTEKYEHLPEDIQWHLIGHLQRNKVKYVVDKAVLIHSVDSMRLAETIDSEAAKKNMVADILIEVNVAEEASKFGIGTSEVIPLIEQISSTLHHVRICGLMTIAPYVSNPEENRGIFRLLQKLSVDINDKNINNVTVDVLSMGMSNDYEVAVEEGATMVRVGTGIFGERNYNIAR